MASGGAGAFQGGPKLGEGGMVRFMSAGAPAGGGSSARMAGKAFDRSKVSDRRIGEGPDVKRKSWPAAQFGQQKHC